MRFAHRSRRAASRIRDYGGGRGGGRLGDCELINQSFFKTANLRKPKILILQKVSHKSKMLIGFGILVMRRFMTQISKKATTLEIKLKYKSFNSYSVPKIYDF